jgi:hypothetical protein
VQLINFIFKPEVAVERRDSVVSQIEGWNSVAKAAPLNPDAKHPGVRRMYYAYVTDGADVKETVECLSSLSEVESADVPAQRFLVG